MEDAMHLVKDIHNMPPKGRSNLNRQLSQNQPVVQTLRRQARMAAEDDYFKKQIIATQGEYDEAVESKKLSGLPRFTTTEIYCGDKLGNGAFGTVYEVLDIVLDQNDSNDDAARSFMAQHCLRDDDHNKEGNKDETTKKDARYAIKKLRSKIVRGNKEIFQHALIDVATETRILASIPHHPNVIKLRGIAVSEGSSGGRAVKEFPACCFHEEYFLVLDRLYGTLEERLDHWTKEVSSKGGNWLQIFQKRNQEHSLHERTLACLDLASALAHLHKHNIVHRDIKPPNVGFNIRGDLTVFDFGLSRELPKNGYTYKSNRRGKADSKLYRMTGFCGSPRYMAPEVGLHKVYNAKCDVYSFGVLAWQILTLQKPYEGCDITDLKDAVWPAKDAIIGPSDWTNKKVHTQRRNSDTFILGKPPKSKKLGNFFVVGNNVPSSKPRPIARAALANMIDRTFRRNINSRPTMKELEDFFRKECRLMAGESYSGQIQMPVSRRRSTYVFAPPSKEMSKQSRTRSWSKHSSVPVSPTEQRNKEDSTHFGDNGMFEFSESSSYEDALQ